MVSPIFSRGFQVLALSAFISSSVICSVQAENWTRFRGDNGSGISTQKGIPTAWSPGDYAFNIELPGVGHSSPVVWNDKLFLTSAIDKGAVRVLLCLDAKSGNVKWSRIAGLNKSPKHLKSSWASSTPAVDGERVYVAFADKESYTLTAYDFEGTLVWRRNLGSFESQHGQGTSPIIFEDMIIITNDQDGPSSVIAFDRRTGQTVWSTLRSFRRTSYATPLILAEKGKEPQLICASGQMGVTSLDPYTGRLNWMSGEFPLRTVASPVYADGLIIQSCGGGGIGKVLVAVDPSGKGDVSKTHIVYVRDKILPYVPTPVAYKKHVYLWNDNGVVSCIESRTGKNIWTKRVGGNFSGSTICIDGKIYIMNEEGDVIVIAASPEYKFIAKTALNDPSHSTPAIANGRLYLRTFHRLFCLEAEQK